MACPSFQDLAPAPQLFPCRFLRQISIDRKGTCVAPWKCGSAVVLDRRCTSHFMPPKQLSFPVPFPLRAPTQSTFMPADTRFMLLPWWRGVEGSAAWGRWSIFLSGVSEIFRHVLCGLYLVWPWYLCLCCRPVFWAPRLASCVLLK